MASKEEIPVVEHRASGLVLKELTYQTRKNEDPNLICPRIFNKMVEGRDFITLGPCFKDSLPYSFTSYYPILDEHQKLLWKFKLPLEWQGDKSLRYWPTLTEGWNEWIDRVQEEKAAEWERLGIFHAIQLSRYEIPLDGSIIASSLCFWSTAFNCFHFRCGPMAPTVLDICHLIGLFPFGEEVTALLSDSKITYTLYSSTSQLGYTKFISLENKKTGRVSDQEHCSFLLFWLCKYIFCTPSQRIVSDFVRIAKALASGRVLALAPFVLAYLYRSCYDMYASKVSRTVGGPLWLLQLWLHAYFPELGPKFLTSKDFSPSSYGEKFSAIEPSGKSFEACFSFFFNMIPYRAPSFFLPFNDPHIGPSWLLVLQNHQERAEQTPKNLDAWASFLISRDLHLGHSSARGNNLIIKAATEVYIPCQFARQFGLAQAIPFPLCSIANTELLSRVQLSDREAIKAILKLYTDERDGFQYTPFTKYPLTEQSFENWWSNYIDLTHQQISVDELAQSLAPSAYGVAPAPKKKAARKGKFRRKQIIEESEEEEVAKTKQSSPQRDSRTKKNQDKGPVEEDKGKRKLVAGEEEKKERKRKKQEKKERMRKERGEQQKFEEREKQRLAEIEMRKKKEVKKRKVEENRKKREEKKRKKEQEKEKQGHTDAGKESPFEEILYVLPIRVLLPTSPFPPETVLPIVPVLESSTNEAQDQASTGIPTSKEQGNEAESQTSTEIPLSKEKDDVAHDQANMPDSILPTVQEPTENEALGQASTVAPTSNVQEAASQEQTPIEIIPSKENEDEASGQAFISQPNPRMSQEPTGKEFQDQTETEVPTSKEQEIEITEQASIGNLTSKENESQAADQALIPDPILSEVQESTNLPLSKEQPSEVNFQAPTEVLSLKEQGDKAADQALVSDSSPLMVQAQTIQRVQIPPQEILMSHATQETTLETPLPVASVEAESSSSESLSSFYAGLKSLLQTDFFEATEDDCSSKTNETEPNAEDLTQAKSFLKQCGIASDLSQILDPAFKEQFITACHFISSASKKYNEDLRNAVANFLESLNPSLDSFSQSSQEIAGIKRFHEDLNAKKTEVEAFLPAHAQLKKHQRQLLKEEAQLQKRLAEIQGLKSQVDQDLKGLQARAKESGDQLKHLGEQAPRMVSKQAVATKDLEDLKTYWQDFVSNVIYKL